MELKFPNHIFSGSYISAARMDGDPYKLPEGSDMRLTPVVNNVDGSIVGYKYFNFDNAPSDLTLWLELAPKGGEGTITVYAGDPYESDRQVELGKVNLHADEPDVMTMKSITVSNSDRLKGKMPVYFRFESDKKDVSLCDFYTLRFQ